MEWIVSTDGTRLGVECLGAGPALLAVQGTTADRTRWQPVSGALSEHFELHLLDRRGRGLSVDEHSGQYSIELEAQDIVAVCTHIGHPVTLLAHSFGGACALAAAPDIANLRGLLVYEPAFATPGQVVVDPDVLAHMESLIAAGDRGAALEVFFVEVAGVGTDAVAAMRGTDMWQRRIEAVHTIGREFRACSAFQLDADRLARIEAPVRVLVGQLSPEWLRAAASATHEAIAQSDLVIIEGHGHIAMDDDPALFTRLVVDFCAQLAGQN